MIWGVIFPPPEPSLWNLQELSLVMESVCGEDIICYQMMKKRLCDENVANFFGSFAVHCNAIAENFAVWIDCLSKYWDNCDEGGREVLMKIIRTQSKFLGEILLFSEKYFLAKTDTFQQRVQYFFQCFFLYFAILFQMNKSPCSNNLVSRKAKTSAEFVMAARDQPKLFSEKR